MTRIVILPRELEHRLNNLTNLVEEVDGTLLYRRLEDYCLIDSIFMMGVGKEGHVQAQPERIKIANEFFKRNPDYRFVKFHTHSKGTIDKFGQYYATNFSAGDIDTFKDMLEDDKEFMAMLVTPTTKLLWGIDNPELVVVDDSPRYRNRNQAVSEALRVIARNLGYDIDFFQATRK